MMTEFSFALIILIKHYITYQYNIYEHHSVLMFMQNILLLNNIVFLEIST
jgi:hypothetical protein